MSGLWLEGDTNQVPELLCRRFGIHGRLLRPVKQCCQVGAQERSSLVCRLVQVERVSQGMGKVWSIGLLSQKRYGRIRGARIASLFPPQLRPERRAQMEKTLTIPLGESLSQRQTSCRIYQFSGQRKKNRGTGPLSTPMKRQEEFCQPKYFSKSIGIRALLGQCCSGQWAQIMAVRPADGGL